MSNHSNFYGLLCFSINDTSAKGDYDRPELHLNLWEKGESVNLDIGLKLDLKDPSKKLELFFPWSLAGSTDGKSSDVEDLSKRITGSDAIPAIFNESWSVTTNPKNSGFVISNPSNKAPIFTIIDATDAINGRAHNNQAYILSINIEDLKQKSMSLEQHAPKFYIRFRVKNVPKNFYCVGIDQKDHWWLSSWQRTEIIDFRLNVRRGVPTDLEHSTGSFVEFSKVHFFLMKSRDQDIVFEDTLFKSCRSLEDEEFWAGYSSNGTEADKKESLSNIKQSIGYQWSKKGSREGDIFVKEFGILARFKKVEFGIGKFLILALVLGALGNALWDVAKLSYDKFITASTSTSACQTECQLIINQQRMEATVNSPKKGAKE